MLRAGIHNILGIGKLYLKARFAQPCKENLSFFVSKGLTPIMQHTCSSPDRAIFGTPVSTVGLKAIVEAFLHGAGKGCHRQTWPP